MKRPAFQFYGGDWLRDPGLRACSLPARGLWMDMIAIMSQVEDPYGHLVFAATKDQSKDGWKDILTPILPAVLARMVGASEGEVAECLAELESFGVFSRTPSGVIYCRRMVRDEKVRQSRASGGFQSTKNPNVPRKKEAAGDGRRMDGRISFHPSLGGSPASASSSAKNKCAKAPSKPTQLPEWLPLEAWNGFVEMRTKLKAPLTDRASRSIFSDLDKLRVQGEDVEAVLDQSTERAWRGVFAVKREGRPEVARIEPKPDPKPVFEHRSTIRSMAEIRAAAGIQ